jgi:hypothetical protein
MDEWEYSTGGMILTGEIEVLGAKPVSAQLRHPQIPHRLDSDWASSSTVGGRLSLGTAPVIFEENTRNNISRT